MNVSLVGNIALAISAGAAVYGMPYWPLTSLVLAFVAGILTALVSQWHGPIIQGEEHGETYNDHDPDAT